MCLDELAEGDGLEVGPGTGQPGDGQMLSMIGLEKYISRSTLSSIPFLIES